MLSMGARLVIAIVAVLCLARPADADPGSHGVVFTEILGKGGLWGVGYDHPLARRLEVGAVASYLVLDGQHISTLAPYARLAIAGRDRNRFYLDYGPQLVRGSTPSPVPEWMGTTSSGIGTQLSAGYEHRGRAVLRVFAMGTIGRGGAAPWLGADLGWSL